MAGDTYKRRWDQDIAQCGCAWVRIPEYGDVLLECLIHKIATSAAVVKFERKFPKYRTK